MNIKHCVLNTSIYVVVSAVNDSHVCGYCTRIWLYFGGVLWGHHFSNITKNTCLSGCRLQNVLNKDVWPEAVLSCGTALSTVVPDLCCVTVVRRTSAWWHSERRTNVAHTITPALHAYVSVENTLYLFQHFSEICSCKLQLEKLWSLFYMPHLFLVVFLFLLACL